MTAILLVILLFTIINIFIIAHKLTQIKRNIINDYNNKFTNLHDNITSLTNNVNAINNNINVINNNVNAINNNIDTFKPEKVESYNKQQSFFSFHSPSLGETLKNAPNIVTEENHIIINKIKFIHYSAYGLSEVFGRKDYELGGLKDCIFIDVGANVADSTLYAANLPSISHVYAYEPFTETFNAARENILLNEHLSNKITLMDYGWYNENKKQEVPTIPNNSAINSVDEHFVKQMPPIANLQTTTIELKQSKEELLHIIKKHPKSPIILKLDIEGAEYECLDNIGDLLQYVDILLVEWHFRGYEEITNNLDKNNFIWFNEIFMPEVGYIRAYNKNVKRIS